MEKFFLPVDANHELAITYDGNPQGIPVIFLHGGPGAGCKPEHFDYFDLSRFRVILFDQRGCGDSTPFGELRNNTTEHLIEDIEAIRQYFKINKLLLFGGSWGSCLALAYAEKFPECVQGMILRSICLARPDELRWLYEFGANQLFPAAWRDFVGYIHKHNPYATTAKQILQAYYARFLAQDEQAAFYWHNWSLACLELPLLNIWPDNIREAKKLFTLALIEACYFSQDVFLAPNQIVTHLSRVRHIPTVIIHGDQDYLCPVANAYFLHQQLPLSQLRIVANAGHLSSAPGMKEVLRDAVTGFLN